MPALLVSPIKRNLNAPGVLWIHDGGYVTGMKEMVHMENNLSETAFIVKEKKATI